MKDVSSTTHEYGDLYFELPDDLNNLLKAAIPEDESERELLKDKLLDYLGRSMTRAGNLIQDRTHQLRYQTQTQIEQKIESDLKTIAPLLLKLEQIKNYPVTHNQTKPQTFQKAA